MATHYLQRFTTVPLVLFLMACLLCGCQGGLWVTDSPTASLARKVTIDGQEASSELLAAVKRQALTKQSPTLAQRPAAPTPATPAKPTTPRPGTEPTALLSQQPDNLVATTDFPAPTLSRPPLAATAPTIAPVTTVTDQPISPAAAAITSRATPVVRPASAIPLGTTPLSVISLGDISLGDTLLSPNRAATKRTTSKTTPPATQPLAVSPALPTTDPAAEITQLASAESPSKENPIPPWIDQLQLKMISRDAQGRAIVMLKVRAAETIVAQEGETVSLELNGEVIPVTVERVKRRSVQLRNGLTNRQRILR